MSNTTVNQALRILAEHSPKEVAAKIGYKSAGTLYGIRSGKAQIGDKLAAKIVEAYGGKVPEEKNVPVKTVAKKPAAKKEGVTVKTKGKELDLSNTRTADAFLEEIKRQENMDRFEGMARAAVSKVVKEEVVPALNEKIGRAMEKIAEPVGPGKSAVHGIDTKELDRRIEAAVKKALEKPAFKKLGAPPVAIPPIEPDPDLLSPLEENLPDGPSGYCPSDLPSRGINAPKTPRKHRFLRRSK